MTTETILSANPFKRQFCLSKEIHFTSACIVTKISALIYGNLRFSPPRLYELFRMPVTDYHLESICVDNIFIFLSLLNSNKKIHCTVPKIGTVNQWCWARYGAKRERERRLALKESCLYDWPFNLELNAIAQSKEKQSTNRKRNASTY